MKDNKLHTPAGVRDFLTELCAPKLEIQQKITSLFHSYGFLPIETPTVEYLEVFEGKGSVNPQQMFQMMDRDGEILVLRSDLTPPAVRVAVTDFSDEDLPLRFSYAGNVFRNAESDQGKLREYTQAGIELMGVNSRDADGEVLAIAIHSLLNAGLKDFRIAIGQVQFFEGLTEEMKEAGMTEEDCRFIQDRIIHGDFVSVLQVIEKQELPRGVKTILQELSAMIGGKEVLQKADALVKSPKSKAALEDLLEIYEILEDYRLAAYVKFDLSMLGYLDYYTGFICSGYTHGTGFSLLEGGRYDKLMCKFGKECPAVGFSIKLHDLLRALQIQGNMPSLQAADTLVAYTREGRARAVRTAVELRRHGVNVENSLLGSDIQVNLEYAKRKNNRGLIYFVDDGHIQLTDLRTGRQAEVTLAELRKEYHIAESGNGVD